jgi:hypothetical protein
MTFNLLPPDCNAMIFTPVGKPAPFQMHSHDYRVRVTGPELKALRLDHLCTLEDPKVFDDVPPGTRAVRTGVTEWHGAIHGQAVTMAWDWYEGPEGTLHFARAVPPRSNLMLIDGKGYDAPHAAVEAAICRFVSEFAWQGCALRDLGVASGAVAAPDFSCSQH